MKIEKIKFKNRIDAAEQLYNVLPTQKMEDENWTILATSAGAVPIALNLAIRLECSFDYIFTHKIYTKKNSGCEVAIVTETEDVVVNERILKVFNLNLEKIYKKSDALYLKKIIKYKEQYRDGKDMVNLEDKNVLLIDEGLNTGLTMMACIKSVVNQKVKSICVAVPILPNITIQDIETIADDLYYIKAPEHFISIDYYYDELEDIEIDDINQIKINLKEKNGKDM